MPVTTRRDLDRALCERLGIEPERYWVVGDEDSCCYSGSREQCEKWEDEHPTYCGINGFEVLERLLYPGLSSHGDGMLELVAGLHRLGFGYEIKSESGPATAMVFGYGSRYLQSRSGPAEALALAAAMALGIEVALSEEEARG